MVERPSFRNSVALLGVGTATGQAITLVSAPILTRLYTPADFGAFGVFAAIVGFMAGITTLQYGMAIPLPARDRAAASLLVLCVLLATVLSGVVGLLTAAFGTTIAGVTNTEEAESFFFSAANSCS